MKIKVQTMKQRVNYKKLDIKNFIFRHCPKFCVNGNRIQL